MTSPNNNIFSIIRSRIEHPAAPFAHLPDDRTLSYSDMLARSAQFANALLALGVSPGDRIAVQVDKSIEALFLYLACVRAGGVYLPLNSGYRDKELAYFIDDAEPHVFVCTPERLGDLEKTTRDGSVAHIETLTGNGDALGTLNAIANNMEATFDDIHLDKDDLAAILYTSGTTGRSKGAMLTHNNLASNALTLAEYWRFSPDDVLLHVLPIFHTHGLFVATNTILVSGASMIFQNRFDVDAVMEALPRATVMMGVPTYYSRLLASGRLNRDMTAHMRLFVSGSAPLSPETHKNFEQATGHAILERYGMTETNMNTSNPYDGDRRAGTVGFPLPGIEIRISDRKTGEPVARGEVGVIEIRGPNVFKGYWRMPEKTRQEFRDDGFFISGDLGRVDEQGYISIVGRTKDLIISGGYNVYPAEVENALDAIDSISESAVIGVPHADFGECVTAVVVADEEILDEEEIRNRLSQDLAKFKIPKKLFFVDHLPRNKMGKIQKNELRQKYKDTYSGKSSA